MANLFGDIITMARELMNDPPQLLPPPTLSGVVAATSSEGPLGPGTYYGVATLTNQWGETTASIEFSVTLAVGQNDILITPLMNAAWDASTGINIYIGQAAGQENIEYLFPGWTLSNLTLNQATSGTSASPPPTNSAYLPDTDGSYVRAATIFRWLQDGLRQASIRGNGIPDYSGFPSTINFATYMATGQWVKLTEAWYDGYPVSFDQTITFYKRNQVTSSVLGSWALSSYNGQLRIEMWPQPARTATLTSLAAPLGQFDTAATLTSTGGFLLPTYGMVQIGQEIMGYNGISGNQLIGLLRGFGGTRQQAWANGSAVNECNCMFQGTRIYAEPVTPGMSANTLYIPAGWDGTLVHYLMSKYFATERDTSSAKDEMAQFDKDLTVYNRTNRQIVGPKQAGTRDYQFIVFGGTRFGGNIIP